MVKARWCLVFVLMIGCSFSDRKIGSSWDVNEQSSSTEQVPDFAVEPADVVILQASRDDPYYGSQSDFYGDFFGVNPGQLRCAALTIIVDLQFQEPVILVLPKSITQTSETYGLEIPRHNRASWLLSSQSGGQVWVFKGRSEFESSAAVHLLSFPFVADALDRSADPIAQLQDCGVAPEGLIESILLPPENIEVEIWANGESTILPMAADIQQSVSGVKFTYRKND